MSGKASRARGARAEVNVVNYLREQGWPDARRYLAGDGRQPGDIDAIPGVCIEVKDRKQSAWPTWREQVLAEAGGRVPVIVRRVRGNPDVGQWIAEMPSDHYRELAAVPFVRSDYTTATSSYCYRTDDMWVRHTFAALIGLFREDEP